MTRTYWRIFIFFIASYTFTWFGNLGNWLLPSDAWPVPMLPLGPLFAAIFVIFISQGSVGLKLWFWRIAKFRAPIWVYLVAFFVPLVFIIASVGLAIAIGTPHGALPIHAPLDFIIYIPLVLIDGPAPEETSFRGFAQQELQQEISPLATSLVIGLGVLIWHLPVLIGGYIPWPIAIALIAVSVVYAWIYISGDSIWPVVTLHFVQNYFGGGIFGRIFAEKDGSIWVGFLTLFYVLWAITIAWKFGPSLGLKSTSAASSNSD